METVSNSIKTMTRRHFTEGRVFRRNRIKVMIRETVEGERPRGDHFVTLELGSNIIARRDSMTKKTEIKRAGVVLNAERVELIEHVLDVRLDEVGGTWYLNGFAMRPDRWTPTKFPNNWVAIAITGETVYGPYTELELANMRNHPELYAVHKPGEIVMFDTPNERAHVMETASPEVARQIHLLARDGLTVDY